MSTTYYADLPKGASPVRWACRRSGWRPYACAENTERTQVLTNGESFAHVDRRASENRDGSGRHFTFERYGANDVGALAEALGAHDEHEVFEDDGLRARFLGPDDEEPGG